MTGDQVATHRAYDPNFGRIQLINTYPAGSSAASLQSLNYSFDSIGNLQSRTDTVNGLSETYSYDPLNELTLVTATTTGNSTPSYSHFAYEQVGGQSGSSNPDGTYRVSVKASVGDYSYTYSSASSYLLAGVSDSWVDNPFSYDIDGNTLTDESARTYTWTSFDMPSTIKKGSTITYFAYDPEHRRIQQGSTTSSSSPESNATPTVNYFWVGSAHFEEVLSSSGTALWRDYVTGPDGSMASNYNGQVYYIHGDHQNSSNVETQSSGNFNSFSGGNCYDPWGKRRFCTGAADSGDTLTGSPENTRGYTGEEQLDAFDLVHLNNRLYDPEIGRFVSQDPAGLRGGQNPYAYTGNNPMSRTDRNGLGDCAGGNDDQIPTVCVTAGPQPFNLGDYGPIDMGLGLAGIRWDTVGGAYNGNPYNRRSTTGNAATPDNDNAASPSSSSASNQAGGCGAAGNCPAPSPATGDGGVWIDGDGQFCAANSGGSCQYVPPGETVSQTPQEVDITGERSILNGPVDPNTLTTNLQLVAFNSTGIPVPPSLQAVGIQSLAMRDGDPQRGYTHILQRHSPGGILSTGKSIFHPFIVGDGGAFSYFLAETLPLGGISVEGTSILVNVTTLGYVGWDVPGNATSSYRAVLIPSSIPGSNVPGSYEVQTAYPTPGPLPPP